MRLWPLFVLVGAGLVLVGVGYALRAADRDVCNFPNVTGDDDV